MAYQVAGLDGITSPTIEQVGIREVCMGGIPGYQAWYQMYPSPVHAEFSPAPGDVVDTSVSVSKSGGLSDPKYWNTDKLVQPLAPHHGIAGLLGPSAFTDTWA